MSAAAALLAPSTHAAVINVDAATDVGAVGGTCELREAIDSANVDGAAGSGCANGSGPDMIDIGVPGPIVLNSGAALSVGSEIVINGGSVGIEGPPGFADRIFDVTGPGDLTLKSLKVQGGRLTNGRGAGIRVQDDGELVLDQVTVTDNQATGDPADGGGIYGGEDSLITVLNGSEIGPNNVAGAMTTDGDGGGIFIAGARLVIEDSLVAGNAANEDGGTTFGEQGKGGGIGARPSIGPPAVSPSVTISDSQIGAPSQNSADIAGGGVSVVDGALRVSSSWILDNQAPGVGLSDGNGAGISLVDASSGAHQHSIVDSLVESNDGLRGGGLFSSLLAPHSLEIERTTFSGNTATVTGGGASLLGLAQILNSTFSGNSTGATGSGGGLKISSTGGADPTHISISHSTIAQNLASDFLGAGINFDVGAGDTLTLGSSVLHNPSPGNHGECNNLPPEPVTSAGYNIALDDTCDLNGPGDLVDDAMLDALADNGAAAVAGRPGTKVVPQTHALLMGSPAIDHSPVWTATDQRGIGRPQGAACDSGSFELVAGAVPSPACSASTTPPPPGGSSGGGGGVVAQDPSNLFELGKLLKNKKKGIAFLLVNVPGPGEVGLAGKGVKNVGIAKASARKSVFTPGGVVKLKIKPGKGKKARKLVRALKNKGKAKLKVRVTFVPTGGIASTQARKVKLVRK